MAAPGDVLNIGPVGGRNHFMAQTAPTGGVDTVNYTQDDIAGGLNISPYFTLNGSGTAVQFYARADAPKTSGSASGARSELRETNPDGSYITFSPFDGGTHYIKGKSKITHHPTSGVDIANIGITLAQLHNGNSDRLTFRTQIVSSTMRLRYRVNGSSVSGGSPSSLEIVPAGQANIINVEFPWMMKIYGGNGTTCTAEFYVNNMATPWHTSTALNSTGVTSEGWYFKAGNYNNFDTANVSATEYGQTELRDLEHWHTGWPTPVVGATTSSWFPFFAQ